MAIEGECDVGWIDGVAADEAMGAEEPDIPAPSDRRRGELFHAGSWRGRTGMVFGHNLMQGAPASIEVAG